VLRALTKRELWDIEDAGRLDELPRTSYWHLKSAQDAVTYQQFAEWQHKRIGEVGGGESRLLPVLAQRNECFNFEVFDGRDGGPAREVVVPGVTNVRCLVGETEGVFEGSTLDAVFSISVVEHVPTEALDAYFSDCRRLLKPGGLMFHVIDVYIADEPSSETRSRLRRYRQPFDTGMFQPLGDVLQPDDFRFSCAMVSNPDHVMAMWNRSVPAYRSRREESQCVAIVMAGTA